MSAQDGGERKNSRGCTWAVVIACILVACAGLALVATVAVLGSFLAGASSFSGIAREYGADERPEMEEVWAYGAGRTKVVAIPLQGMILLDEEEGFFSFRTGSGPNALRSIRRATFDRDVQALILQINSGGGGITASDVLYDAVLEFKSAQPGRQVIALLGDVAASGAYYVAAAADYVVAHPTTLTGSIGVLLQSLNMRELGEKIGVRDVTIKSGANKDILNPLGEFTEEQRAMLQAIVDEYHARFVTIVARGRGLPEDQVAAVADGRVFTAARALSLGLIDELGYWPDAMDAAADLLEVDRVKVYRYDRAFGFADILRGATDLNPRAWFEGRTGTRFLYLWRPVGP